MTALGGFLFELWYGRALNANEWMELKLEGEMLSGERRFNANKARFEENLTFFLGSIGERRLKTLRGLFGN